MGKLDESGYGFRWPEITGTTVTGSGADTQVTFWTGTETVSGNSGLRYDYTNNLLGVHLTALVSPGAFVDIGGATTAYASLRIRSGTVPTTPNSGDFYFTGGTMNFFGGNLQLNKSASNAALFDFTNTALRTYTFPDANLTITGGGTLAMEGFTLTFAGNFTTTGAFNTTFAASANATYTLPSASSRLLANNLGISGGSTLIGGTAASESLQLTSTSNATRGFIYLGNASAYDDVNARFGIGVAIPLVALHVIGGGLIGTMTIGSSTDQSSVAPVYVTTSVTAGGTYATDFDPAIVLARTFDATLTMNGHSYVDASIFKRNAGGYANNAYTDNGQIIGTVAYNHHASFQSQFNYNGSGTLTTLYGLADNPVINSGTVTNKYGVYIFNPTGAGAITTHYGVYIPALSKAATNWGLYVVSNDCTFGGVNNNFGATAQRTGKIGETAASGELPQGIFIAGTGSTGNMTMLPTNNSNAGSMAAIAYYNGTQYYTGLECAHVSSGFSTLKLMKSGGFVAIGLGATAATAKLHLGAGSTTVPPFKFISGTNLTVAQAGAMEYDGTTLWFTNGGVQRQELVQYQQSRVSTQFDKTNTTLANVTGLTATLVAGNTYQFTAVLHVTADATGGSKFAIAGTATATNIIYEILMVDNTSNLNTISSRQTALAGSAGQAGTTSGFITINGVITVNAAGTLTVQFAQNAANGTSSVLVGSTFIINQIV